MFFKIYVLKNFAMLTGKHLCWSLFLIKLQQQSFLQNTSGGCFCHCFSGWQISSVKLSISLEKLLKFCICLFSLTIAWNEFAKLRAFRAFVPYVSSRFACPRALHALIIARIIYMPCAHYLRALFTKYDKISHQKQYQNTLRKYLKGGVSEIWTNKAID